MMPAAWLESSHAHEAARHRRVLVKPTAIILDELTLGTIPMARSASSN
jgi:hypothetical protein